jgi:hypothetical protein
MKRNRLFILCALAAVFVSLLIRPQLFTTKLINTELGYGSEASGDMGRGGTVYVCV